MIRKWYTNKMVDVLKRQDTSLLTKIKVQANHLHHAPLLELTPSELDFTYINSTFAKVYVLIHELETIITEVHQGEVLTSPNRLRELEAVDLASYLVTKHDRVISVPWVDNKLTELLDGLRWTLLLIHNTNQTRYSYLIRKKGGVIDEAIRVRMILRGIH